MSNKRFGEPANILLIAVVVSIAVGLMTCASVDIESLYLENHSFFYDPASYYQHNCSLLEICNRSGTWQAILYELFNNDRFPARTIPHLLVNPSSLADLWGHLWTEVATILVFLFLLAYTLYKRTSSLCLAFASIALFCSARFLYDPFDGIAGYWLDTAAACTLGSSVLCLLNFCITPRKSWFFAFGLFASLTALCRWSAAFYFLAFAIVALPAAVWAVRKELRKNQLGYLISLASCLPGIIFTLYFLERNIVYYKTYGYGLSDSIFYSLKWLCKALILILGIPLLSFLLMLSGRNLVRLLRSAEWLGRDITDRVYTFIALWFPVSIGLFLCLIVKSGQPTHSKVYFLPALLVAALCPIKGTERHWRRWQLLFVAAAAVGVLYSAYRVSESRQGAVNSTTFEQLQKQSDVALCELIAKSKARSFAQFDFEHIGPQLELFFKYGTICKAPGNLFSIHESYLTGFFGKQTTPDQMADLVFERVRSELDLVAVFTTPSDALKAGVFDNPYTATISKNVSERVQKDPNFKLVSVVDGPNGELSVYQNIGPELPRQW